MKTKTTDPTLTASRFSAIVGLCRNELLKRLAEQKATPTGRKNGGDEYDLRTLFNAAIGGDIAEQRLRKVRAEADKLEHDLRVRRGEYVPVAESVETVIQCGWDIRNAILSMPIAHAEQDKLILHMQRVAVIWQARADALAGDQRKD